MTVETPAPARGAASRLVRGASLFVGSGALFYAALTAPTALGQASLAAPWWTPLALIVVYAPAPVITVGALCWRFDLVRIGAVAFALGYLVAATTWLIVHTGAPVAAEKSLWLTWLPGLPALALCICWRRIPFAYLVVAAGLSQLDAAFARGPSAANPVLPEFLFAVAYSALPCAACVVLMRVGRELDQTAQSVRAKATAIAAANARRFERHRFDALTHDWVIATLLEASRTQNSAILTQHAEVTLRDLERLRTELPDQESLDVDQVVAGIRAAAAEIDDTVPLHTDHHAGATLVVPRAVANALGAAACEALRNWQRHAGSGPQPACQVRIAADSDSIRVDVVDDGVGFDPAAVPPDRLGIRASITDRLTELPGGWSAVDSAPGHGCRISAGWTAA